MRRYICDDNKYAYGNGYIYLPINLGTLPEKIKIDGDELGLKSTFHISLLCVKNILARYEKENLEEQILEYFCKFVLENEISFLKFTGEFRLARLEERKTIIAECEISNLAKFSQSFSKEFGIEVPVQPAHVTLYTLQPDVGIGLNSQAEMKAKSVSIEISPEIMNGLTLL